MMNDSPSRTAELVCFMRAGDAKEPEAQQIGDDPYAHLFLSPLAKAALHTSRLSGAVHRWVGDLSPGVTTFVLARHRFIDECLHFALERDRIEQVVLLGAGYDTRAYRFSDRLGDRPVFEVDHPMTSARKRRVIEEHRHVLPPAQVTRVEVDFRSDRLETKLADAGFRAGRATFFVWEGVSMYLRRDHVKATLQTLMNLGGSGSELAMDYWFLLDQPDMFSTLHRAGANMLHFLGEPITFGIHPEDVGSFMMRLGWRAKTISEAKDLEARFVPDRRRVSPANYVVHAMRIGD